MQSDGKPELRLTSADGTHIAVRRVGSGDPVILVHGAGGGLHSWAGIADQLANHHAVWTPARRGYWPSDAPPGVKTFEQETADLAAVIEAAQDSSGRPVHVVGASYGATLAMHAAVAGPDGIRTLAIFEPPLFAAGPDIAPLVERYRLAFHRDDFSTMAAVRNEVTRIPPEMVAKLTATMDLRPVDQDEARRSATGWLHDLEALAGDSARIDRWSAITTPTLLLRGSDSWAPIPSVMKALAETIPGAREIVWQGQSHFATMTAPALVADTLGRYFEEFHM